MCSYSGLGAGVLWAGDLLLGVEFFRANCLGRVRVRACLVLYRLRGSGL